jgi:hypothetical protein
MADELGGFEDVFDAGGKFDGLEEVGTPPADLLSPMYEIPCRLVYHFMQHLPITPPWCPLRLVLAAK